MSNESMLAMPLLTEREAAERLRVCPKLLYLARKKGDLRAVRIGTRVLYTAEELSRYVQARTRGDNDDLERKV